MRQYSAGDGGQVVLVYGRRNALGAPQLDQYAKSKSGGVGLLPTLGRSEIIGTFVIFYGMTMEKDRRYFTLPRKMVAAMTSESWERIPHAVLTQEADLQNLLAVLKDFNAQSGEHVTLNSAMLKLVAECLKAAPRMNGHMRYRRLLVSGYITLFDHVDISVPMKFPGGMMVPVTLHGLEEKSMRETGAAMADVMRRVANTNMEEAMSPCATHSTNSGAFISSRPSAVSSAR